MSEAADRPDESKPPAPAFDAPAFDAPGLARLLARTLRAGGLSTLDEDGAPFGSLVAVATDFDGAPLLLLSQLAAHTRHLQADGRCALLLAEQGKGDPLAHPRLTLRGRAAPTDDPRARRRFLARNPKSALYADFADFAFWRIAVEGAHLNGGFARAATLGRDNLIGPDAPALEAAEPALIDAIAASPEVLRRLVAAAVDDAAARGDPRWRATGLDPRGVDLAAGDRCARALLAAPTTAPNAFWRAVQGV